MAYMDYMDLDVCCPQKAVKPNHCLTPYLRKNVTICQFYQQVINSCDINFMKWWCPLFIIPPPLGAGGIMFSGCPSICPSVPPSVRPSEAWNTLFWPVHGSVGPPDQPWRFYSMSVCPSVRLSVCPERFPGICWRTHGGNGLKFCTLMYLDHL